MEPKFLSIFVKDWIVQQLKVIHKEIPEVVSGFRWHLTILREDPKSIEVQKLKMKFDNWKKKFLIAVLSFDYIIIVKILDFNWFGFIELKKKNYFKSIVPFNI